MPNGRPHDHPLTDIVLHGMAVYSPLADDLVRKIVDLGGQDEISDMLYFEYVEWETPDIPKRERVLTAIHERLRRQRDERGS